MKAAAGYMWRKKENKNSQLNDLEQKKKIVQTFTAHSSYAVVAPSTLHTQNI